MVRHRHQLLQFEAHTAATFSSGGKSGLVLVTTMPAPGVATIAVEERRDDRTAEAADIQSVRLYPTCPEHVGKGSAVSTGTGGIQLRKFSLQIFIIERHVAVFIGRQGSDLTVICPDHQWNCFVMI